MARCARRFVLLPALLQALSHGPDRTAAQAAIPPPREHVLRRHEPPPRREDAAPAAQAQVAGGHSLVQAKRRVLPTAVLEASDDAGNATAVGMLQSQYPYYHTSAQLSAESARLAKACGGKASVRNINKDGVSIDVVRVKADSPKPTNRVFILFGEHSRELISPETGLHLLKVLCGEASVGEGKPTGADVLKDNEFELVLNGNPRSRSKVEEGQYCLRENPAGVDLNRNWDEKWEKTAQAFDDTQPGPRPFSEPETRIFKDLVSDFKPSTFLTVHSGTRGMYMPWAYNLQANMASRNERAMMNVLRTLDGDHCKCPFGAAGREIGYPCPGTSLDWVFDKMKSAFSFAFEIYTQDGRDAYFKRKWEEKVNAGGASLLQQGHSLAHRHFAEFFQEHASDFVHFSLAEEAYGEKKQVKQKQSASSCFAQFNPKTEESYKATVNNWVTAYLQMAELTNGELKRNSSLSNL